ncbi:MAG: hypothetical protein IJH39_03940 [Clostridia bacterium]|nr:hypothetical protein [Clostridia bacterium]
MAFNGHQLFNAMVLGLEDKKVSLGNYEIPDDRLDEVIHFFNENEIQIIARPEEIKRMNERPEKIKYFYGYVLEGTNREKKIFMQVYKILGEMIEYNYYAISEEGKKDFELTKSCRSLKEGLLKGKAVCAGYANILKNIIEEFGIEAKYISAEQDKLSEFYDEKDPERSCME